MALPLRVQRHFYLVGLSVGGMGSDQALLQPLLENLAR